LLQQQQQLKHCYALLHAFDNDSYHRWGPGPHAATLSLAWQHHVNKECQKHISSTLSSLCPCIRWVCTGL
jgi:hypothetical protein